MKKELLIILCFFYYSYSAHSQNKIDMDQFGIVGQISKQFYEDIPISNSKDTLTFNTKMLNVLFTKEVSNYLSESTNLNTRKSFAILNDKNNRLFLGGSFAYPFNRNKYDKLTNLFTLGVKADSKDGFANIFGNSDLVNNLAVSFKYTFIGRGKIFYDKKENHKEKIKRFREEYLLTALLRKKVDDYIYNNADIDQEKSETLKRIKNNIDRYDNLSSEEEFKVPQKKLEEIYFSLIEEEINNTTSNKWYNFLVNWWLSIEACKSITKTEYNTSLDASSNSTNKSNYSPFEFSMSLNGFIKSANYGSLQGRFIYTGFENNSIRAELTNLIKSYTFVEYQNQIDNNDNSDDDDNLFLAQVNDNKIYVGDFKKFFTNNFKAELVYFFPDKIFNRDLSFIGISAAIEKNLGAYDAQNWKLGIPFVFKDKDGKASINFEIQWREINKLHTIGFSLGVPFGKFVK